MILDILMFASLAILIILGAYHFIQFTKPIEGPPEPPRVNEKRMNSIVDEWLRRNGP